MGTTLATKTDLLLIRQDIDKKFALLSRDIESLRASTRNDIETLRSSSAKDLEALRLSMTARLGSIVMVEIGDPGSHSAVGVTWSHGPNTTKDTKRTKCGR